MPINYSEIFSRIDEINPAVIYDIGDKNDYTG